MAIQKDFAKGRDTGKINTCAQRGLIQLSDVYYQLPMVML